MCQIPKYGQPCTARTDCNDDNMMCSVINGKDVCLCSDNYEWNSDHNKCLSNGCKESKECSYCQYPDNRYCSRKWLGSCYCSSSKFTTGFSCLQCSLWYPTSTYDTSSDGGVGWKMAIPIILGIVFIIACCRKMVELRKKSRSTSGTRSTTNTRVAFPNIVRPANERNTRPVSQPIRTANLSRNLNIISVTNMSPKVDDKPPAYGDCSQPPTYSSLQFDK